MLSSSSATTKRNCYHVPPGYNGAADAKRRTRVGEKKLQQQQHSGGKHLISIRRYSISNPNFKRTLKDHKTLKHGVWVIACYYAHGRDINIHRRVYSLHKRAANGSLAKNCFGINLVHYLMDNFTRAKSSPAKASPPAGHLRIATDNNNLLPQHTLWRGDASSSTHDPPNDSDPTSLLESPLLGPAHRALSPNEMSLSSDFSLDSSLLGLSPEMRQVQNFGHEVQNFGHESRSHSSAPALMHTETQIPSSGLPAITAHSPHWSLLEVSPHCWR